MLPDRSCGMNTSARRRVWVDDRGTSIMTASPSTQRSPRAQGGPQCDSVILQWMVPGMTMSGEVGV